MIPFMLTSQVMKSMLSPLMILGIEDDLSKQVTIREEACARMLLEIAKEAKRISKLIVDENKLRIKKTNTLSYDLKHEQKS